MAEMGIKALVGLKWEVAEPLLAEMWSCVQIMPDPTKPHVIRNLIEEDIEEITTRIKLRAEVWKLHTGFLKAVVHSISEGSRPAAASKKGSRNT
jgi:flagellar motor component MotA